MDKNISKNDFMLIENYIKLMWGEFNKIRAEYQLAPLILAFSLIEANAKLCAPDEITDSRERFIWWVDKYLKNNNINYVPLDLYGARCGLLHEYGAESDLSRSGKCRVISWTGGDRQHHGKNKGRILLLSKEQFFEDLNNAGLSVLHDLKMDIEFQVRFADRLKHIFGVCEINKFMEED